MTVDDVLITGVLATRAPRPRDVAAEHEAYRVLARHLTDSRDALLQQLVEFAMTLCGAGTVGVSVSDGDSALRQLRWAAIAGAYASFVGGSVPGDFSPCGACLRSGRIELYAHPARVFHYLGDFTPPIVECLVVPFSASRRQLGTVWIMSHDDTTQFTSADAACLVELAAFCAAALEVMMDRDAAAQSERAKEALLARASHELKTPASAILGWADLLLSGRLDAPRAAQALAAIHAQAQRQCERIEDLLDVRRIATGRLTLNAAVVDVRDLLIEAVAAAAPHAAAKHVELALLPRSVPAHARVDQARMRQALENILMNGVKFTPAGGRVAAGLRTTAATVEILVTDTGDGIAPDILPHVFDPFRRATAETTRHAGLGLGLTIASHIIAEHGGRIRVDSGGVSCGTTVTVALPALGAGHGES